MMPGPVTRLPNIHSSSAILVGVSDYDRPSRLVTLPAVRNNLDDLAAVLTDRTYGGFTTDRCRTVLNPRTRDDIAQAVCQQAVDVTDTFLVYYAGHGLVRDGKLILAAGETDPAHAWHRGLRYDDLRELLLDRSVVRAANHVVILDCCFAGRAHAALNADIAGLADIAGVYVLTATSPTAVAIAPDGEPHTAFTGALLRVLTAGLGGGADLLPLEHVFHEVKARLAGDRMPLPMQSDREDTRRLALVRNRAAGRRAPSDDIDHPEPPVRKPTPKTENGTRDDPRMDDRPPDEPAPDTTPRPDPEPQQDPDRIPPPPVSRPGRPTDPESAARVMKAPLLTSDGWALGLATGFGVAGGIVVFTLAQGPVVVAGAAGVAFAGVYAIRSALTRHQK